MDQLVTEGKSIRPEFSGSVTPIAQPTNNNWNQGGMTEGGWGPQGGWNQGRGWNQPQNQQWGGQQWGGQQWGRGWGGNRWGGWGDYDDRFGGNRWNNWG